ncbi:hypothetical protein MLAC_27010 [Mycobacterium lacus]|uniref:Uncharacterized protein n=1 Tax=Mycobacterium lacus TaxID=169765 RepID=A0A7I7NPG4_9MYCO|nr:hypothetical protein MLAC_27010 [Mycobacterium lacus]
MPEIAEIPRDQDPFPTAGVSPDSNGVPRHQELPATLLDMLAEQVDDAGARLDLTPDTALPDAEPYVTEKLGPEDTAALFYTSGERVPMSRTANGSR